VIDKKSEIAVISFLFLFDPAGRNAASNRGII